MDVFYTYRHAISGGLGGGLTVIALHPFDTIRTRIQVVEGAARTGSQAAVSSKLSTWSTLRSIVRTESFAALYKGLVPAVIGSGFAWAAYFQSYNFVKSKLAELGFAQSAGLHFAAGTTSGIFVCILTNPVWVVKTGLQLQIDRKLNSGQQPYTGFIQGLKIIFKEEGIRGLYKGLGPSLWLVSQGALQFAAYEELKSMIVGEAQTQDTTLTVAESLVASSLSKLFASTALYPLQVVRTRMQKRRSGRQKNYKSFGFALRTIARREGWRGFYKGLTANLLRVTPSAAITFIVYEQSMKSLGNLKPIEMTSGTA
uniref:Mitochondrial carrier protein n=1 Tax=Rhodosorus marinus TaxID=101924 RepID=A0A7S2ZQ24_9RHOD|mmetsp:Transcript_24860/g.98259  ORF Transcript_24860/g.98259 Transcript_24860/m.98259 type:complete len:313 (+) Transcript_24860:174-1112(+)